MTQAEVDILPALAHLLLLVCNLCGFEGNSGLVEAYTPPFFNFQNKCFALQLRHITVRTANGYYIITLLNLINKLLLILCLLLLRADHKKVEH